MAVLLLGYLGGWAVTSVVVGIVAWRVQDKQAPAPHLRALSILAGALWPVLVVALAQAGAVALTAGVLHEGEHLLTVDA